MAGLIFLMRNDPFTVNCFMPRTHYVTESEFKLMRELPTPASWVLGLQV